MVQKRGCSPDTLGSVFALLSKLDLVFPGDLCVCKSAHAQLREDLKRREGQWERFEQFRDALDKIGVGLRNKRDNAEDRKKDAKEYRDLVANYDEWAVHAMTPPEAFVDASEDVLWPEKYNEQIQTYEAGLQGQGKLDLAIGQQETREDQQLDSARVQPDLRIRTMKNSQANKTTQHQE